MKRLFNFIAMCVLFAGFVQAAECTVTLKQSDMGVISVSYNDADGKFVTTTESFTVNEGTDIFVKVQANDRKYALEAVLCNGERLQTSSSYRVVQDIELEAQFVERTMCSITLKPYSNGKVSVTYIDPFDMGFYDWKEGEQIYSHSVMMISATPDQDYMLEGVFVDGEKLTGASFTIYSDIVIEVRFKKTGSVFDYRLENNYDPAFGDVTVTDSDGKLYETEDKVFEGTKLTITVTPKAGCIVKSFKVNDEDMTDRVIANGAVIVCVSKDVYIDTVFEEKGAVEEHGAVNAAVVCGNIIRLAENVTAEIYNMDGRRIAVLDNSGDCDITALAPGVYVLKVTEGNMVKSMKFVK